MALVNEFGQPYLTPQRFAHAADRSRVRGPQYWTSSASIDDLIPPADRMTLVSVSQRLYTNKGVVRACVEQKAEYSVGNAYLPEYLGADSQPGDEAESWLANAWFPNCDVRGGVYDFQQNLTLASIAIDREGEVFVMLTETSEGGFPLAQQIPGYKIRSKHDHKTVEKGPFKGARLFDGIIYNKRGRAIGYRVYPNDEDDNFFEDVPASSMIHLFNPRYQAQGRGLPAFTHALEDLKHSLQSTEDERRRQAIISGLGLIVTNELGGPDLNDPAVALNVNATTEKGTAYENRNGLYYLTANQGEKLEQIQHDSPGDIWESFHDRLIREAITGVGWSYSLVWKPSGQGTAERGEILRARRAVEARQKLLDHLAKRLTTYAVAYGIKNKLIPNLGAPLSWRFTHPPRLSVDDGRESKAQNEEYVLGRRNLRDLLEADGKNLESHFAQRVDELVKMKLAMAEGNKRLAGTGMQIDEREMRMLTPNEQPGTGQTTDPNADPGNN